jgi:hypothetical protein
LVERNWPPELILNLPFATRKAIYGISLKNNPNIKDFSLDKFIDRPSYFDTDAEVEEYMMEWQEKMRKAEEREEKELLKKNKPVNSDQAIEEIEKRIQQSLEQNDATVELTMQERIANLKRDISR